VTTVIEAGLGNDSYLVANNEVLAKPAMAPLWDDFTLDRRYLTRNDEHTHAFLWFGPRGTVTPLHHDAMNVLFNQVVGRKRFQLISPLESPYLYNSVSVYSDVDILEPDIVRFPLFAHAHPIELVLEPGETLFVPVGWWHHVESLDLSISVSFTNFVFENDPEWYELEAPD
jgi:ribosomal protein L16 Arg81 hydroxylase